MKLLHRPDLYAWSRFDEARNIDFHSVLWTRESVVVDPLPMSDHEQQRLLELGGVKHVIITNSDHVRGAAALASAGARLYGPLAERDTFPIRCDAWLAEGDEPVAGLEVRVMNGSKTPGELALVLEGTTLISGDLIRGHQAGRLNLLPDGKLADRANALASLRGLLEIETLTTVLVGDGWPVFNDGRQALQLLALGLET
jgi:hypothetical protein